MAHAIAELLLGRTLFKHKANDINGKLGLKLAT